LQEIIADNLSKAGWEWGCVSAIDSTGRIIWIADAHRGDGKRFVVRADEKRTPMIPEARALFERMRAERPREALNEKVFRVREAQKAIDHACKKVGIPRFTHHDLRHLFATVCIEKNCD
jgi:integrase